MFLSFLSCSLFSYAANPRAVIVKCDGCAYDVDVDVDISNKGNHKMQQHGSKYFGSRPPPPLPLGIGSVGQIQLFQTYQIKKENRKCSNSVVNILLSDPSPPTLGVKRSNFNSFRSMSCCISN